MKDDNIKILLDRYFEGLTSLNEEQKLRDYFQQENVSPEWEIYMPIFRHFATERASCHSATGMKFHNNRKVLRVKLFRWGSIAAAACLLLIVGLRLFVNTGRTFTETSQAYIDGKKYTDIELIRTETLKSLENIKEGSEDAYSSQIEALKIFIK